MDRIDISVGPSDLVAAVGDLQAGSPDRGRAAGPTVNSQLGVPSGLRDLASHLAGDRFPGEAEGPVGEVDDHRI